MNDKPRTNRDAPLANLIGWVWAAVVRSGRNAGFHVGKGQFNSNRGLYIIWKFRLYCEESKIPIINVNI